MDSTESRASHRKPAASGDGSDFCNSGQREGLYCTVVITRVWAVIYAGWRMQYGFTVSPALLPFYSSLYHSLVPFDTTTRQQPSAGMYALAPGLPLFFVLWIFGYPVMPGKLRFRDGGLLAAGLMIMWLPRQPRYHAHTYCRLHHCTVLNSNR